MVEMSKQTLRWGAAAALLVVLMLGVLHGGQDSQASTVLVRKWQATVRTSGQGVLQQMMTEGDDEDDDEEDDESPDEADLEEGPVAQASATEEDEEDDGDASTHLNDHVAPGSVIDKKVFWEKSRIVYIAGLQDSGQDEWKKALKEVCAGKNCRPLCATPNAKLWFAELLSEHNAFMRRSHWELDAIRNKTDPATSDTIYLVNLLSGCATNPLNDMGFPPTGRFKADRSPDMHLLAGIAEEVGVDLRIVVLLPTGDMVKRGAAWGAKYRNYESMAILQTMEQMMQAMYTQLVQIGSDFFTGVDMNNLPQDGTLDAFTGLQGLEAALQKVQPSFKEAQQTALEGAPPQEGAEAYRFELELARAMVWNRVVPGSADMPVRVPKRVFSTAAAPRPRMLFVAGLEGTGHHLWRLAATELLHQTSLVPACPVESVLFQNKNKTTLWFTQYTDLYKAAHDLLKTRFRELVEADAGAGKTYLANLMDSSEECNIRAGMMSYPNFKGKYKTLQRPNIITLAKLADEAGIDLRIIVLLREGDAIIRSTVDHRHFGGWGPEGESHEIRFLTVNAFAMYAQMNALDPRFFSYCADFDTGRLDALHLLAEAYNLEDMPSILTKLAHFPSPPDEAKQRSYAKRSLKRNSYAFSLKTTMTNMEVFCPDQSQ